YTGAYQHIVCAACRDNIEAKLIETSCYRHHCFFVMIVDADKDCTFTRQVVTTTILRFEISRTEGIGHAHHLSRRSHLGAENWIDTRKLGKREDWCLDMKTMNREFWW